MSEGFNLSRIDKEEGVYLKPVESFGDIDSIVSGLFKARGDDGRIAQVFEPRDELDNAFI